MTTSLSQYIHNAGKTTVYGRDAPWVALERFRTSLEKRFNTTIGEELGSGWYGAAFLLGNNRVLKITVDQNEAFTSNTPSLRTGKFRHIGRVYDVFSFPPIKQYGTIYGLVLERLTPMSSEEKRDFNDFIDNVVRYPRINMENDWATVSTKLSQDEIELMKRFQMDKILDEVMAAGISFHDYQGDNLMKRGKDYVITDLGAHSRAQQGAEPNEMKARFLGINTHETE